MAVIIRYGWFPKWRVCHRQGSPPLKFWSSCRDRQCRKGSINSFYCGLAHFLVGNVPNYIVSRGSLGITHNQKDGNPSVCILLMASKSVASWAIVAWFLSAISPMIRCSAACTDAFKRDSSATTPYITRAQRFSRLWHGVYPPRSLRPGALPGRKQDESPSAGNLTSS